MISQQIGKSQPISDKTALLKGYLWKSALFCLIAATEIKTAESIPVNDTDWTDAIGAEVANDISAALTAREACIDPDRSTPVTGNVAACHGEWYGHIQNASSVLCSDGFSVCTWEDEQILKQVSWATATQIAGCYAYNAAQDTGRCQRCKDDDMESDDLAAIGHDCAHINSGHNGCLSQGQISASCCADSLQKRACTYTEGLTTGVLCCRRQSTALPKPQNDQPQQAQTVISPVKPIQMVRLVGERVQLRCPLIGVEVTTATANGRKRKNRREHGKSAFWLKDGNVQQIQTATWTISFASTSDSGFYACREDDASTSGVSQINLTINAVHSNACADGTSDGFHDANNVRACAGSWTGHVRRAAATLCGRGWRVCTPKDRPFLDQIDPTYLTEFGGCFGYNAAHIRNRCRKCKDRQIMAALGGDCSVNQKVGEDGSTSPSACYANRKIVAYSEKSQTSTSGCNYRTGKGITGVMCCRRWQKNGLNKATKIISGGRLQSNATHPSSSQMSAEGGNGECLLTCRNGGTCLPYGQCLCPKGYTGHACQNGGCSSRCINGGECLHGVCKCAYPFHGDYCQFSSHMPNDAPVLTESGRRTLENNILDETLAKRRRALPRFRTHDHQSRRSGRENGWLVLRYFKKLFFGADK